MPSITSVRRQLGHRLNEASLPGLVVGMSYSYNEFFQEALPEDYLLLSNAQGMKLIEAHFGKALFEAYEWGTADFAQSEAGQAVLDDIEASKAVPAMLAWEYLDAPDGEYTLVNAERLSNSFLGVRGKSRWNLIGDPFRAAKQTEITKMLLEAENEVLLPFEIVRRLRALEFELEQRLPIGDTPKVVEAIEEEDRQVTVVVPTWADMERLDWATHRLFPKDDFPVFAATVADVKRYGPREVFGAILETCRTRYTSKRWFRRGSPLKTAEELDQCKTVGDFSNSNVPEYIAGKPLERVFSPFSVSYPPGSDRKVMTVWTLNTTNWVILLPGSNWWDNRERAWYLYRAASSAREGIFLVEE